MRRFVATFVALALTAAGLVGALVFTTPREALARGLSRTAVLQLLEDATTTLTRITATTAYVVDQLVVGDATAPLLTVSGATGEVNLPQSDSYPLSAIWTDDFLASVYDPIYWYETAGGSGAFAVGADSPTGIPEHRTGTTISSVFVLQSLQDYLGNAYGWTIEARVIPSTDGGRDITDMSYTFGAISGDGTGALAAFAYDTAVGANWVCSTANAAAATTNTDSGLAYTANAAVRLRIRYVNAATDTVTFWIDGVQVAQHTSAADNIPPSSENSHARFYLTNTAAEDKLVYTDWFSIVALGRIP